MAKEEEGVEEEEEEEEEVENFLLLTLHLATVLCRFSLDWNGR